MSASLSSIFHKISTSLKTISPISQFIYGTLTLVFIIATFALTFHIGGIGATKAVSETAPIGKLLYLAATPGSCDGGGGIWTDYGARLTCLGTQTEISNTFSVPHLAGTFITAIPGQLTFPSDYVIEVYLVQESTSNADFGIYFRNQPGQQQMGVYTFLIHPDGSWSAYVYDNSNGAPTEIKRGHFGVSHASVKVDVAVIGDTFTLYENGHEVDNGNVTDNTYPNGTVGIAVDHGGTILASNFAIYTPRG